MVQCDFYCRVFQKELYNCYCTASVMKTFTLKGVQTIHRSRCCGECYENAYTYTLISVNIFVTLT
jgi:hypothetical protein